MQIFISWNVLLLFIFEGFRPNPYQSGAESIVVKLIFLVGRSSYECYLTFPFVRLGVPGVSL